jgi:Zn-dependent M28 family amino/carboxypeptidase
MKKKISLLLLVILVAVSVGIFSFLNNPSTPKNIVEARNIQTHPSTQIQSQVPINTPLVSADKLFAHIKKLNFTRYTPGDRSRARNYISNYISSTLNKENKAGSWEVKLEEFPDGVNIIALRPGTDKKAGTILVGAHYDSVMVSPGADDNASGVAVTLEIARLLGSRPTPKTLEVVLFDKEETGLKGSIAFTTNPDNIKDLKGAIIMDMVGFACHTPGCQRFPQGLPIRPPTDKGDFLAVIGDTEHPDLINAFSNSQNLPPILKLPIPGKGLLTPDLLRSDHAPFWYQNIGAVLVSDTANFRTPYYHQASDTPSTIDRKFFTGSAQLIINAVNSLL